MPTARERTLKAKGKSSIKEVTDNPRQIVLRGHRLVMNPFSMTTGEKIRWRERNTEFEGFGDEADFMLTLASIMLERVDASWTWERVKAEVTWQEILDAVAGQTDADADHPEG